MSFKVGGTVVIDNNGKINWNRLTGLPAKIDTAVQKINITNCGDGSALQIARTGTTVTVKLANTNCNCNCDCNCLCRD